VPPRASIKQTTQYTHTHKVHKNNIASDIEDGSSRLLWNVHNELPIKGTIFPKKELVDWGLSESNGSCNRNGALVTSSSVIFFYVHVTVHRDRCPYNKTN
jgi:hypothetical protein